MSDKILFHSKRLIVWQKKITVGDTTIFYPSVSVVQIYDGKPMQIAGIWCLISLAPLLMGWRMVSSFNALGVKTSSGPFWFLGITLVSFGVWCLTFTVKCLFVTVNGQSVAILRNNDFEILASAKIAIEKAKADYESSNKLESNSTK